MVLPPEEQIVQQISEVDEHIVRLERGLVLLAERRTALTNALQNLSISKSTAGEVVDLDTEGSLAFAGVTTHDVDKEDSISDMIQEVLRVSALVENRALTPKEIAARIRTRWPRPVSVASINSVAWRMARNGELHRDDGKYSALSGGEVDDHHS